MLALSDWAESSGQAYPFRMEDWLRYQVGPPFLTDAPQRVMLAGESAVRENILIEKFAAAFPDSEVFLGAMSAGTMNDIVLSLRFIEREYGVGNLPSVIVLGLTFRQVANIPPAGTPFTIGIDRYNPHYLVEEGPDGYGLVEKSLLDGMEARARWWLKQRERFPVALVAALRTVFREDVRFEEFQPDFDDLRAVRQALSGDLESLPRAWSFVNRIGPVAIAGRWFRIYIAPYKYHHLPPRAVDRLRTWVKTKETALAVKGWHPREGEQDMRRGLSELRALIGSRGIRLLLVNMPENPIMAAEYRPGYAAYLDILKQELGGTPILDLHTAFPVSAFHDFAHLKLPAAIATTERVVEFAKRNGLGADALGWRGGPEGRTF